MTTLKTFQTNIFVFFRFTRALRAPTRDAFWLRGRQRDAVLSAAGVNTEQLQLVGDGRRERNIASLLSTATMRRSRVALLV